METHFAPPERLPHHQIDRQVRNAAANPVVDVILKTVGGFVAVLNEHRQVVALNKGFLDNLSPDDTCTVFGLRPGEALACTHSREMPGGCGTSKYCSTCGAAIAIVSSLARNECVDRKCVINVRNGGALTDLCFAVRACPLDVGGERFIVLFLQDNTARERKAELDRMFFHDVANIVHGLVGAADVISLRGRESAARLAPLIKRLSLQLNSEMKIQRALAEDGFSSYRIKPQGLALGDVVAELTGLFENHHVARGKKLTPPTNIPAGRIRTDPVLLQRVLSNMITNAFEASRDGEEVRLDLAREPGAVVFSVWNRGTIPEDVCLRIFERHFSTKADVGRGLGTYSMKVFGEKFLGGKISFSSSPAQGTTFTLRLPQNTDPGSLTPTSVGGGSRSLH